MKRKESILVGMSGGVDSCTTAALLTREGHSVVGVTLKLYEPPEEEDFSKCNIGCCGARGVEDARSVCQKLGIRYYVLNYKEIFQRTVIEEFQREYQEGRTPNPCVTCNQAVKFGMLLDEARRIGFQKIATGHYARIEHDPQTKRWILKKGVDPYKDQSYFLWVLPANELENICFPLGAHTKSEVRHIAKELGLRVFNKPGSKEICFIPNNDYRSLLQKLSSFEKTGFIITTEGKILGEHPGIAFYTIGQRRGLGLNHHSPLYVVALDRETNSVIVGEEKELYSQEFIVNQTNWISIEPPVRPFQARVRIRYQHEEQLALVEPLSSGQCRVCFEMPQRAITPGQSAVFYQNDIILGGGKIAAVEKIDQIISSVREKCPSIC